MTRAATIEHHVEALRASPKFLKWAPEPLSLEELLKTQAMDEKHFAPDELAALWGVSAETIRNIFRDEPGVLKIGKTGGRYKRGYMMLRIPQEVAERVHKRLSA